MMIFLSSPFVLTAIRIGFVVYFLFAFLTLQYDIFPNTALSGIWLMYLVGLYLLAERVYAIFLTKGINLTFAFPLLLLIYLLNFISMTVRAQERFPLLSWAENYTAFIFIGYTVWVFFIQYLPHNTWAKHPYYTALLVLSVSSALGVWHDHIKLLLDGLFHTRFIGARFDTNYDVLMNTLGTGTVLLAKLWKHKVPA